MAKSRFEPCNLVFEIEKTTPGWALVIYLKRADGSREEQRREQFATKKQARAAFARETGQ